MNLRIPLPFPAAALLLAMALPLGAKTYPAHDIHAVVKLSPAPEGGKVQLDVKALDRWISDLADHARNYPVAFDSETDEIQAHRDVETLTKILGTLCEREPPDQELLRRKAFLHAMGHNMDLMGEGDRAIHEYDRLLAAHPEDALARLQYGLFLGGANQPQKAIPHLLKAREAGFPEAHWGLGMAWLMTGDKARAIESFERYAKAVPGDPNTAMILEGLRKGGLQVQHGP